MLACAGILPAEHVIWVDFDMHDIEEPSDRKVGYYEHFFSAQFIEQWKQGLDVPRWIRTAAARPKQATNVNALDEVPDSSWFTNRHARNRMSLDELVRGPDRGPAPDFSRAVVTNMKSDGVTPGLEVRDANGVAYLIKFDNAAYPELQSAAEIISTKILYALGYNVPENYIAWLNPQNLTVQQGAPTAGQAGDAAPPGIDAVLQKAARMPDGRYRVLASKILAGKPKGPFAHVGLRADDPNDRIPHEHRRDLRGLSVIASWINHWDMKEINTLDMYVEENDRRFLRHYLIDFGSTLGGGKTPLAYFHGREYALDGGTILKEIFSLGFHRSASEKQGVLISPQIGSFSSDDFDPDEWKPSFPVMAFDNMTDEDAFWAMRLIMSLTDDELRAIVDTARYTHPADSEHILKTLLERRRILADHWLRKVSPLSDFGSRVQAGTTALTFRDLATDFGIDSSTALYKYEIRWRQYTAKSVTSDTGIVLDRVVLDSFARHEQVVPIEITIRAVRNGDTSPPVTVHVIPSSAGLDVVRIARG
jgi:hypothetical protein